jgi:hypothetical protein
LLRKLFPVLVNFLQAKTEQQCAWIFCGKNVSSNSCMHPCMYIHTYMGDNCVSRLLNLVNIVSVLSYMCYWTTSAKKELEKLSIPKQNFCRN